MSAPVTHAAESEAVDLPLARRTWRALEAYHGMIYFSPEAADLYAGLGLSGRAGYFASRSAAMGPVSADVVIATFYNFNPDLVRAAIPAAWQAASPEAVLSARREAADVTLRRILGQAAVDSEATRRAAELARRAAEAVTHDVQGRPLYAAHAQLPWPDEPHLVLWHAQTLLREYRGDGHVAALLTAQVSGIEALITNAASGAIAAEMLRTTRAWPEDVWEKAVAGLRDRGWLTADPHPTFTPEGRAVREQIEAATDRLSLEPYRQLGREGCEELRRLAGPLTAPLVDELMPWLRSAR